MKIHVKPARPDLLVHDPETNGNLSPSGRIVSRTPYWARRERDGSIVITEEKAKRKRSAADSETPSPANREDA